MPIHAPAQTCDPGEIFAPHVGYAAGDGAYAVAIGDLDGDGDGDFTLFDFLAFQNAFDAGCP